MRRQSESPVSRQRNTYPSTTYEQVVMERHSPDRDCPQAIQALNAHDKRVHFGRLVVAKKTHVSDFLAGLGVHVCLHPAFRK